MFRDIFHLLSTVGVFTGWKSCCVGALYRKESGKPKTSPANRLNKLTSVCKVLLML